MDDLDLVLRVRVDANGQAQVFRQTADGVESVAAAANLAEQRLTEAQRAQLAFSREGARLAESLVTPTQRYAREVENLNRHLAAGHISQQQMAMGVQNAQNEMARAERSATLLARATGAIIGSFTGTAIASFAKSVFDVNREMQSLRTSMITAAGSSEAATAEFEKLKNFKIVGVVGLKELAESYTRLKNLALDASETTITAYANIAAANPGKSTADFIEAVADATTGEMGSLKEFGIKASQTGETITFSFKGVETTVKNSADAVQKYLVNLGNSNFAGVIERQANKIDGSIAQLKHRITDFMDHVLSETRENQLAQWARDAADAVHNLDVWFNGSTNLKDKIAQIDAAIAKHQAKITAHNNNGAIGSLIDSLYGYDTARDEIAINHLQRLRAVTNLQLAEQLQGVGAVTKVQKQEEDNLNQKIKLEEKLNQILEGKYKTIITQAAEAYKVDQNLMLAIAQRESGSGKNMGRSSTGDWGLMQINEKTAPQIGNAINVSVNKILTDPETNAKASAWYVSWLQQQFSKVNITPTAELFAAAYNGGFGNLEKAHFNLVNLKKTVRDYALDVADTQQALSKMSGTDWFKSQYEGATKTKQATFEAVTASEKLLKAQMDVEAQLRAGNISQVGANQKLIEAQNAYDKALEKVNENTLIAVTAQEKLNEAYQKASDLFAAGKISQAGYAEQLNSATDTFDKAIMPKVDSSTNKALEDYNSLINKINTSTGQLGATNNAVFDSALGGINTLVSAFNNMSAAIDANTQSQLDLNAAKAGALADIRTSKDDEFGKAIKEKKLLYDFDKASKKLAEEKNQTELSGARQIIGATAQMFDKKSSAAKALHGIEMGIAAAEMAMKAQSIASNIAATTSGVVAGAAKFFAQSGWAAFAGIAAMIGVIGALGGTTSSPSMPSIDTKTQGTVLGDKTKSSNTAENLGKIMEDIHASEYLALLNINESIKKLNDSILAAVTGIFQRGDLATPTLPANTSSMFVNTRNEISQNRLTGKGNTLGAISDGWQFDLSQFIETKRTKDLLFGHMVKTSTSQNAVSDQTNRDVTAIYKNSGDMLIEAGKIFGMDVKDVVNAIRIPDLDIDIKDMTGEEAIKTFNAYISTSIDQMAGQVFPELAQYQKIGEGLGETVGRVAADVGIVKSVFDNLHVTLPTTAVGLIAVSEALVLAADGTDKLTTNLNNFYNKFYSDTEQALDNFHFLTQNFARKGIELPTDRLGYRDAARNALAKAGTDSDILAAAKTRLDELTKAAFAPFEKNLEIRKNNAERYGGEDARLYKIAQDEVKAAVKAATKSQADYVAELQKSSNASAENANLLLEQSDNADAYYSAIEKGQKALDPRPFRTSVNAFQHEFSKVSNQAIPTSIEGYRNLINSIDTSTEAGRRMHDGLVMLAPDFVDLDSSLSGLKEQLGQVYVGGNDFTDTVLSLADAFGSADKAAQVLKDSIKLVYSGSEVKTMSVEAANKNFTDTTKNFGLDKLTVNDAKGYLKWLTEGEIKGTLNLGDKITFGGKTLTGAQWQAGLVSILNPIDAANNMNNSSASKSQTTDDSAKKAEENAKTLLGLNTDISKQLASIKASDMEKSILDINSAIDDMIAKAREAGGTLLEAENLRAARLQKLASDWAQETNTALGRMGNSDLQNQLADISEKFIKLDSDAKTLAKSGLINLDEQLGKNAAIKQDEIGKLAQSLFDDPFKQYQRIGNTDLQNQLADIGTQFDTLRTQAKQLAAASPALTAFLPGVLDGIDALEKVQKQKLFKDLVDEFEAIGKIDYQKNLDGINQWADDMIKVAPSIAKAYDISTDDAIKGIQAISNARTDALVKEKDALMKTSEANYRKLLIQSSGAVSSNLELQLIDIKDQFTNTILNVIEKGGDLNDVAVQIRYAIETGTIAYQTASKEIKKAADEIFKTLKNKSNDLADQIYKLKNPNDTEGLYQIQYQRELAKYMQGNYQDQIEAINTVQSLAMSRYDAEISAINKIYDASKAINKYLSDLKLNERLSLNTNKQIVDESKAQFATQLAAAKAGDATALSEITTYADKYLNSSRDFYGVSQDYAAIRDSVTASLAALGVTDKVTFDQQTATATTKTVALLQDLQWAVNNTTQLQTNQLHNDLEALGSVTAQIGKAFTDSMYDLATKYQVSNQQLLDAVNRVYDATSKTTASSGVPSTPSPASSGDVMSTFYSKVDSGDWLGAARYAFSVGGTKHDIATAIAARGGSYGETMNWLVMQGFATGGNYPGGLALVGEQGPEIINFRNPGQVYTAPQTRELMRGDNGELIAAIKANAKVIADEIIRLTQVNVEGQSELIAINEEQREEIARLRKEMARAALKA